MNACLGGAPAYALPIQLNHMRLSTPLCLLALAAVALTGCQSAEKKLGRGLANLSEPLRFGEMGRSIEQTTLWDGADVGKTRGVIHGFNRTVGRTLVGAFEVLTFPVPSDPYIKPVNPVYPDSFKPRALDTSTLKTDTNLGFSGGDVAPMFPGSRFRIFSE